MNYNTNKGKRARWILFFLLMVIIAAGIGWLIGSATQAAAEDRLVNCWVMCKPGSQVNVRREAAAGSIIEGYLEAGDSFLTDGESRNGWIRCYGIGENGGGWVYCGYVVTEEPQQIFEQYVCVAVKRLACRKWIGGPQVDGRAGWLKNLENVQVFYMADGWAVTNRGYVKAEWLEVDPA